MSTAQTMVRTSIAIGEANFLLAQDADLDALKQDIVTAVQAGGDFVEFVVVGNRTVSALLTGRDSIILSIETVPLDARDTGDVDAPFGTFFDEL
ncbi:hypothetical protein ACFXP7_04850 [Microbacterium sp. P06]|uniref:hypothetical protein n=1 Tax=unclassified Microbacterium TaxID=2609290 RepID=UPI00374719F6